MEIKYHYKYPQNCHGWLVEDGGETFEGEAHLIERALKGKLWIVSLDDSTVDISVRGANKDAAVRAAVQAYREWTRYE